MRELARLANAPASAYEVTHYTFLAEHCSHMPTVINFQAEVMRELPCPANAPTCQLMIKFRADFSKLPRASLKVIRDPVSLARAQARCMR